MVTKLEGTMVSAKSIAQPKTYYYCVKKMTDMKANGDDCIEIVLLRSYTINNNVAEVI